MHYASVAALSILTIAEEVAADELPPIVQSSVIEARISCKPEATHIEKGFVTTRDVNGDGRPDYILDYSSVICADGSRGNCGSAGCLNEVFVSSRAGYVKVLNDNVRGLDFKVIKGRLAMMLKLHGGACGKVGAEPCEKIFYWNGSKFIQ